MASPAPSTTSATHAPQKQQEQITFRFCRECSNMLYPKEDPMTRKLMFACRTCQFSEEAQSSCVFRNNMYNTVGETAGVTQDVGSDPTVGESVSSQVSADQGEGGGEEFMCTYCGGQLGEEFVELMVGEEGGEEVAVRGNGGKETVFDLSKMSYMEEEDVDSDGEADSGQMDEAFPKDLQDGDPTHSKP
ncbi:hypothetical protein ACLMJK_004976 [Lecanora helva]